MKNKISFFIALAFISLLTSCAKEGPTGPQGIAGPGYTGSITGHVSLYDKYGNRVLSGLDSATLTLSGVSVATTTATTADVNGLYSFPNEVYTGDYTLIAARNNFATTQLTDFPFLTGTLYKDIKLSAIPDSFINSFISVHNPGSLYDSLVITTMADPLPRSFIVFINSNAGVSSNEYTGYVLSITHTIPANATTVTLLVPKSELNSAGIADSTMVYYAAYSYVVNDASVYEDQATGKNVYNAVNINPVTDSAIAP